METRDQQFAKAAFPMVKKQENAATEKGYRTLALNFPVMILQSGLTQATGFLLAKSGAEHTAYLNNLAEILGQNNGLQLHKSVIDSNLVQYQQLTRKALEASAWLKRYTQALLKAD
jgi:CRISPR-associated protein Cmr5